MTLDNLYPIISNDVNFWMIRTQSGFFYDEYLSKEFIAIGWNLLRESDLKSSLSKEYEESLKQQIKNQYGVKVPGTVINKCNKFYRDIKTGDFAVIVDGHRIAFATIGEYYEEDINNYSLDLEKSIIERIEKDRPLKGSLECPYLKRRSITIIKYINDYNYTNPYLFNAISANRHSLSKLNYYADIILSTCYDIYYYNNKLNISFKVNTHDAISALTLSDFVSGSARILSNNAANNVTVKTSLHSPGDIILQISNSIKDNIIPLLMCYMIVFGGKIGNCEFKSILSAVKYLIEKNYNDRKKELEIKKLEKENRLLEQELHAKELENIEKEYQLQKLMAEDYSEALYNAAIKLDVQEPTNKVINIQDYLSKSKSND